MRGLADWRIYPTTTIVVPLEGNWKKVAGRRDTTDGKVTCVKTRAWALIPIDRDLHRE